MIRFKKFIQLQEALNASQRKLVGIDKNPYPSENAMKLSKGMFPEGEDTTTIPLAYNNKQDVIDHLNKHGFSGHNYKAGTTKDARGRTISIGSVLSNPKTQASPEMIKGFENDNRSSKITPETHDIMISRDPDKVAGAASNKGKAMSSCMTITPRGTFTKYGGGAAARQIEPTLKEGSLVAFVKKKGETDEDESEARILLHPHHAYDENGNITHSVLMPETKVYSRIGGNHSDFQRTMDDYLRKLNPMKPGELYTKPPGVYDDDRKVRFNTTPNSVKHILFNKKVGYANKKEAIKSIKLPNATISSLLDIPKNNENRDDLSNAHQLISEHQKLSNDHFEKLLSNPNNIEHLSKNEKLTSKQIKKLANHKPEVSTTSDKTMDDAINDFNEKSLSIAHKNLIEKHSDKLGSADIHSILDANAEREEKLKKDGITHETNFNSPIAALHYYGMKDKLTPEHIEKIKKSINSVAPKLTGEDETKFAYRTSLGIHPEDSKETIHKKLSEIMNKTPEGSGVERIRNKPKQALAVTHPLATEEHISKGLDDESFQNPYVAKAAMNNKNASINNILKGLKHPNFEVQKIAAQHRNNNQATINQALSHDEPTIRHVAAGHDNATPVNISKALKDPSRDVNRAAMDNLNANSDNIKTGLQHNDFVVRSKALNHPNATNEHYKMALNDSEPSIKARAQHLLTHGNSEHNPYL